MAISANLALVILEIMGLRISIGRRKGKIFAYYTQISNLITLLSSLSFLLGTRHATGLRFLSTCMLTMTFLITLFVLVPMGGGFRKLMLLSNGLYHHTICPILGVASYLFLEPHDGIILLPVGVTFVYGMVMLVLNGLGRFDGPYPFFRVRQQSVAASALWIIVLTGVIALISFAFASIQ